MKKVEVIVQDKNTLVLQEDAIKGDYIDLTSISNVDYAQIENAILKGKDEVYKEKLRDFEEKIRIEAEQKLQTKEAKYELEKQELLSRIEQVKRDMLHKNTLEVQELRNQIETMNSIQQDKLETTRLEVEHSYQEKVNLLNNQVTFLKNEKENLNISQELELQKKLTLKNEEHMKEILQLKEQIENLTQTNLLLQRQKASLNVKQTGEDLESWCDNEVKSYMQNGLYNCLWEKDNAVVRYDDEIKGSKADYLFTIFASKDKELALAKVCLDMKDENPDSTNRRKNADYYKALDSNRKKKECKYAVLVSNLELDRPNDLPIFKVNEYEDMYVVRPAYLMTFLNMLVSLTTRFADLVLSKEQERLEIKSLLELQESFEDLKKTYLDKPLESLRKSIEEIRKQNDTISKASKKIDEVCDAITRSYLNEIENKLSRFDVKLNKAYK